MFVFFFFSFFNLTRKWIRLCQSTVGVATGFNAAIKSVTRCCFPTAACLPCDQATDEAPRARCVFVYQRLVSPMLTEQEVSGALGVQDITQPRPFATVAPSLAGFLMPVGHRNPEVPGCRRLTCRPDDTKIKRRKKCFETTPLLNDTNVAPLLAPPFKGVYASLRVILGSRSCDKGTEQTPGCVNEY